LVYHDYSGLTQKKYSSYQKNDFHIHKDSEGQIFLGSTWHRSSNDEYTKDESTKPKNRLIPNVIGSCRRSVYSNQTSGKGLDSEDPEEMNNPFLYRWLIFLVIANIYFFVWLHRVSVTVIAPDLVSVFAADATALGIMSSSYFYLYAAVQPPVGFLADTLGPRRVITLFTLVACAGALIFGTASNMAIATVGRALIGAGVGGVFVPALKTFSKWYRPNEFTSMTGILLAVGGLGGLSGSLPLTYLVVHLGWRSSFLAIGAISFVWAIACWCIVREKPEDKGWQPITAAEDALPASIDDPPKPKVSQRLSMVLTEPGFWLVTLSLFFSGGALMTFQGLWAIPYLMDVHGYSRVQSGSLLMVIPLGFMIGAPAFGLLTDRWEMGRKRILLYALGLALGCWTIILLADSAPPFFCSFLSF
jgi:sugar phosphate permease